MSRASAIITGLDLCQTSTTYRDHLEKTSNELVEKHLQPERIYVACPRIQIIDKNSEEFRVIEKNCEHLVMRFYTVFNRVKKVSIDSLNTNYRKLI